MYRTGGCIGTGDGLMGALRGIGLVLVPAVLGLAACAPTPKERIPLEHAQALCMQLALDQERNRDPRVRVGVGVGTGGFRGGYGSIGITTDSLGSGSRDPERVYRDCVIQRAGVNPMTGFYQQLGAGSK